MTRVRPYRPLALAAILAATLVAGCGGSSQVKPAAYVKSMCVALGNWRNTIQSAGVALQSSGAANASRPVAKADYERFVSSLVTATQRAATALHRAGTPAVTDGKGISTRLVQAFNAASTRLQQAEAQAKAISTTSATSFQTGARTVTTEIRSSLQAIAAVAPGRSAQLRKAAAQDPTCRALQT